MRVQKELFRKAMFTLCLGSCVIFANAENKLYKDFGLKPRIVVLTDIAPGNIEPDDMESMIRLMAHADLFEIEALITSGGWNSSGRAYPIGWKDSLSTTINAYSKDLPNLMKRSGQKKFLPIEKENGKQSIGYWPSPEYLTSRSMLGSLELGQAKIGENNRSAGSDFIIKLAEENDERPIWILAWGGANTFAQAVWQMEQEKSEEEVAEILKKFRIYTITDQDRPYNLRVGNYSFSSHQYLRTKYSDHLIFIWDESAWLSQNGIGSSNWNEYATHIQKHGNLGRIYPKNKYGVEGDTPSYLHVLPNGLSNPSEPTMVGWGGYFQFSVSQDKETNCYTNFEGKTKDSSQKYERYFYPAIFNNFAARMDWADKGEGNRNPIVIIDRKKGLDIIYRTVSVNETINLDASSTIDPDGDELDFKWWNIQEAGTYQKECHIENSSAAKSTIRIPEDASGKTIHIVCEVSDNGTPTLTSYRRIVLSVK